MGRQGLEETARALVADGKGILAADETVPTLTKRSTLKIESTQDSGRTTMSARAASAVHKKAS